MSRALMFVGGSGEAVRGVRKAMEMGLSVVVSDRDVNAPGCRIADHAIACSAYDAEATRAAARRFHETVRPIHGVMTIGADCPHSVAAAAAELGLPGVPLEAARRAVDKLAMKNRFAADGVPQPWFTAVDSAAHLKALIERHGYPLVLKPTDSRGARGVLRLAGDVDPDWAFGFSRGYSPTGRVLLERYIDGPQVSTESLIVDGRAFTPGFSDRNYEYLDRYAPHIIENGGDLPSLLDAQTQARVRDLVERAAASLGVRDGTIKGDIVVRRGQPMVIELAARLSGGYFCTHEIPLNTGVDFIGAAIQMALGERADPAGLAPRVQRHVCQRYVFPRPGRVCAIEGREVVEQMPGVALVAINCQIGDVLGPVNCHPARPAVVITVGDSRAEAARRAQAAIARLNVRTAQARAAE